MRYRWIVLAGLLLLSAGILLNVVWTAEPSLPKNAVGAAELGMMLLDDDEGVSVLAVQEGSIAESAGIRPMDLLTQMNGIPFATVDELETLLQAPQESDICLDLIRSGNEMKICFPIAP